MSYHIHHFWNISTEFWHISFGQLTSQTPKIACHLVIWPNFDIYNFVIVNQMWINVNASEKRRMKIAIECAQKVQTFRWTPLWWCVMSVIYTHLCDLLSGSFEQNQDQMDSVCVYWLFRFGCLFKVLCNFTCSFDAKFHRQQTATGFFHHSMFTFVKGLFSLQTNSEQS